MRKFLLILMMFPFIYACSSSDEDATNGEGQEVNSETSSVPFAQLANTNLYLTELGDTIALPVGESGWCVDEIALNDKNGENSYKLNAEEKTQLTEKGIYENTFGDWLTIECDGSNVNIYVAKSLEYERTFSIKITKDNKSAKITGTQKEMLTGGVPYDIIKPSSNEVNMAAEKNSVFISTSINCWIAQIEVDGKIVDISKDIANNLALTPGYIKRSDWLTVELLEKGLMITAEKNEGESRTFNVILQCINNFSSIKGTQQAATNK